MARAVAGVSGEVPAVEEGDNGKVLTAIYDEGGAAVEWANPPTELPASLGTAGQVLTVNSGATGVEWASAQGASYTSQMPVSINYSNQIQLNYTPDFKLSTVSYPNANLTMLDSNKAIQVVQQFDTEQNRFYELNSMPASALGFPFFGTSNHTTGCNFRIAWPAGQNGSNKISLSSYTPVGILIYKKDDPTSYYQFANDQVPVGSYGGMYALGIMKNPDGTIHSNWSSSTSDCYWEISAKIQEVYDQDMNDVSFSNFYNAVLNNSTNADKYAVCFYLQDGTPGTAPNGGTQITLGSRGFATTMIQAGNLQLANPVPAYTNLDNGKVLSVNSGATGMEWINSVPIEVVASMPANPTSGVLYIVTGS